MKGNFKKLVSSAPLVLVDFYADWCGPCKMIAPMLKEISAEMGEKVKIIKVDVDRNNMLAAQHQIQGVPTLMLFKNGKQIWRQAGVPPKHQIVNLIKHNSH